jgi:DHA1 family bicyclomycin/chloramphenicol resistance-like MFS transporter
VQRVEPADAPQSLTRRNRFVLALLLGGACALGPFSIDMYLPALPTVAKDLHASASAIALTITAFLVGLAIGQIFAGPLSDTYGRRRPLLLGTGLFAVAAGLGALAPSAPALIVLRAIAGLSAAAGIVITNAVVTDHYRGKESARFLSRLVLVSGLAPIVAPIVGGQVLRFTSWRGIFGVLAGLGVVLFVGLLIWLKESLPPQRRAVHGVAGSLRTMRMLSRDARFTRLAVSGALTSTAFFGYLASSSFIFQGTYGASPAMFSLLFSINAVGMLLSSQLNHFLLRWWSPRVLLGAGLCVCVLAGLALLAVTLIGGLGIWALSVSLFVLVSAVNFLMPDSTALALSLHPEWAGSASAYYGTFRLGLGALATPLVAIGGASSALPLAIVVAVSTIGALGVFASVARRLGSPPAAPLSAAEATCEMTPG